MLLDFVWEPVIDPLHLLIHHYLMQHAVLVSQLPQDREVFLVDRERVVLPQKDRLRKVFAVGLLDQLLVKLLFDFLLLRFSVAWLVLMLQLVANRLHLCELDLFAFQVHALGFGPLNLRLDLLDNPLEAFYLPHEFLHSWNVN